MTTTIGTASIALLAAVLIFSWFAATDGTEFERRVRRTARARALAGRVRPRLPKVSSFPG